MNGSDYIGFVFMLLWGVYALWLVNKGIRFNDTVRSLFTKWPFAHPKEFIIWAGMCTVVLGLLSLILFLPNSSSILAKQHLTTAGTFIEYHGDHGNFSYTFVVQGQKYCGYSSSDKDNLDGIKAGLRFEVYYNPANPNINNVSEPVRSWTIARITFTFFSVLLMGILAIVVRKLGALVRKSSAITSGSTPS